MSMVEPCIPPRGWWIIIRVLSKEYLLPTDPIPNKKAPIDAAIPSPIVWNSLFNKIQLAFAILNDSGSSGFLFKWH